jgi:hypothetical protein
MGSKLALIVTGSCVVLAGMRAPLVAHHAFSAEFDAKKPVDMKGTVTRVQWINPHVWIHISVKQSDGTTQSWAFEAGSPNNLFRRGFTKESLLPGTNVHIDGYQAKDGSRRANGRNISFADGKTLFMGSSGIGAPYELVPEHVKSGAGQAGPGAKK